MQPFPKWVSWVFVGFLAYIIYVGNQSDRPPEQVREATPRAETDAPREYDSLRQLTDGDRWYRALNPSHVGKASIKEIETGKGDPVACGSEVAVLLRGTTNDGANFDPAHDESKPLQFTLGAAPIEALNEGLIGMKVGGIRVVNAPAKLVYKDTDKRNLNEVKLRVTLQSAASAGEGTLAAIATTIASGDDTVEPARCGQEIRAKLSVYDASGARVYTTKEPLSFTLGSRALAWGVDTFACGMQMQEERLLMLPPHYLKQADTSGGVSSELRRALHGNELRIVHITRTK